MCSVKGGRIYDVRNTTEVDGVIIDTPSCLNESNFRFIEGSKGILQVFVSKCGAEDGTFVCDTKFCCQSGFTVRNLLMFFSIGCWGYLTENRLQRSAVILLVIGLLTLIGGGFLLRSPKIKEAE